MADRTDRDCLLASFADMGEAMVIQNVLEAGGVPCRIGDLAQIPSHLFGVLGPKGRSVGLWVLEADVPRARELLADMSGAEHAIDEEALAAEALGAAPRDEEGPEGQDRPPSARSTGFRLGRSSWLADFALDILVVGLGALVAGSCWLG